MMIRCAPFQCNSGALTNNRQQAAAQEKQDKAQVENEASHAAVKVGPYSASASGTVTQDDPKRSEGAWNQTVGSGKEFVGGLVGSEVCDPLSPSFLFRSPF